jgi:uncharacterized protein (TIGR02270 family)
MTMSNCSSAVECILTQHIEELAFAWRRRERAWGAPNHRPLHLQDIDDHIDAHFDGIRIAGRDALAPALAGFRRWRTAEEAFAAVTAVILCDAEEADTVAAEALLTAHPQAVRGAAAALLWTGEARAFPRLHRWWNSDQPALWRAAFPACLPHPQVRRQPLIEDALQRNDPILQARALRAIGEWREESLTERLAPFANGADPLQREEARYALRLLGYGRQIPVHPAPTLLDSPRRRRWLGAFALTASCAAVHAGFESLISVGNLREALWLAIYRGNEWALQQLDAALDGPLAMLAAHGITCLTGLDLEGDRLWQRPDPNPSRPLPPRRSAGATEDETDSPDGNEPDPHPEDAGLLPPDVAVLRAARRLRGLGPYRDDSASLPMQLHAALAATISGEAGAIHRCLLPAHVGGILATA